MSEITRIQALQVEHWQESLVLRAEAVLEAEKKLGDLSMKYSGQLTLELEDERA